MRHLAVKQRLCLKIKKHFRMQMGWPRRWYPLRDRSVFKSWLRHFETSLTNSVKRIQKQPIHCERSC